ncbi:hypothetical protein GT755_19330 [Herbidospora sp. NEAU-GS84]|uniref:Uncharacterized protein n=1 Tax=Herbidospora solisilvae TaxID=2696284 RepID=A0A7C9P0W4_9ACTN|nr:hypothetical protein [Herbidospora solisilvae]NAS23837.1 hypothetical protein [Herbidospora solisilvae]
MSFSAYSAPFRIALEILRDAGQPMRPNDVREALARRDVDGRTRSWTELGFHFGEAAALGWTVTRNGWSITDVGVQKLDEIPDAHNLFGELTRQFRLRRLHSDPDVPPGPFRQFQQNLGYARELVHGGRNLERLGVGAFDVSDLYRAAWTQAVAALDHWVTREIVDRGVALALRPGTPRPPKFSNLSMPVELFERVHHHEAPLAETFRAHLDQVFAFMTFQNPDKIKEGFGYVSTVNLWPTVAKVLTDQDPRSPVNADGVRGLLREIAWRRNNIAHTADHDPERPGKRKHITASDAEETIDSLESVAIAILLALGDPLPAVDYDTAPADVGSLGTVPAQPTQGPKVRGTSKWDESSFLNALEDYCPPDVAGTLLDVYRHAESHPSFRGYYFGEGAYPSVTAWFSLGFDEAAVWSVYTGQTRSVLSVNFEWMRNRGASPDRLMKLAESLESLPKWSTMRADLAAANFARRPSLLPDALSRPDTSALVIAALNDLLVVDGDR